MKKISMLIVLFIIQLCLVSCDDGEFINCQTSVTIERYVKENENSRLLILGDSAKLDYDARVVYVKAVKNMGGFQGWAVKAFSINPDGSVDIPIPTDATYKITIGNQEHILTSVDLKK
jgi:hypothetical protein